MVPPEVTKVLTDNFPSEFVIAGQEGFFVRNVVASFPDIIPVVHLPNRAAMLVNMLQQLSPKIMAFSKDGLVPITEITPDPK